MRPVLLLLALALARPASANWFTDKMTSGYTLLKNTLFGESPNGLNTGGEVHQVLSKKFVELKDDGVSLSYNLIYYNLALNLERECYFRADSVEDCEFFVNHIKHVITTHVKTGASGFQYMLIGDFFDRIFDPSAVDARLPTSDKQRVQRVLTSLAAFFNGPLFAEDKENLTFQYNGVLDKLMKYLYEESGVAVQKRALGQEAAADADYLF